MTTVVRFLTVLAAFLAFAGVAQAQAELQPKLHYNLAEQDELELAPPFEGYSGDSIFGALAAPGDSVGTVAGCTTDFLTNNFSSRAGVTPRILVLHYTVSPNVAGWGDVNAIKNFFQNDGTNASSTFIVDFEGHCKYIVNESMKPWTQTFYNPWSISVEIIATGKESRAAWLAAPGLKKVAAIFAASAKRNNIPLRYVDPNASCVAPERGITDHEKLDCQNSHTDVQPNFPYTRFLELVKAAAAPPPPPPSWIYQMFDGEGNLLGQSSAFFAGAAASRYATFVVNTRAQAVAELRLDNDVRIVRRKAGN